MQEKKQKFPLSKLEIVLSAILTPVIFLGATRLLLGPMNSYAPYWFSTALGFFSILGFNIVWIVLMKLWPLKNIKIKIFLTLLVLTLSTSVLACWLILNALSGIW